MVYIGGHTTSPTIPTHSSAFQRSLTSEANYRDAFVARFSKSLRWTILLKLHILVDHKGKIYSVWIDDDGNVYITVKLMVHIASLLQMGLQIVTEGYL